MSESEENALKILWSCGLSPRHHDTLEKAAIGVQSIIQELRLQLANPPPDVQEKVLDMLGLRKEPTKLLRILTRLRPWSWKENESAPADFGISIKIPWKDRKPRKKDENKGNHHH